MALNPIANEVAITTVVAIFSRISGTPSVVLLRAVLVALLVRVYVAQANPS